MTEERAHEEARPAATLLASEIKRHRTDAGLSQPQLAQRIGYTRQYVSLAERPGHNLPSLEIMKAIDEVLEAGGQLLALREQAHLERQARRNRLMASADLPEAHAESVSADPLGEGSSMSGLAPGDIPDLLTHLREQWHLLVKTDNLFGPRFALSSVHDHLGLVVIIARSARGSVRREVMQLAAQYAESAAWLHEDAGEPLLAERWTGRAMEWSHEADDRLMLAWTLFRRSQHATTSRDPARVIGMAHAAHREGAALPSPMRAAITQQEAQGYALDGDARTALRMLDEAHKWAVSDTTGEARGGHGSFCTASYLELQRANCLLTLGRPREAVELYDTVLPTLPPVYRRDRGAALSRFAMAAVAVDEPERAAQLADEALDIARGSGSIRTETEVRAVANALSPYDHLPPVTAFRARLTSNGDL